MSNQLPNPPTLNYARAPKRGFLTTTSIIAVTGGALSFLNYSLTCCMCGYQDLSSGPGNALGTTLAIWAFTRTGGWGDRLMAMAMVIFCTVVLAFNVHNVLWSGHGALLH